MNKPKLIFIHLPKSGGTSQLRLLESIYDPERVLWWPRVDGRPGTRLLTPASDFWEVAGGHIPIGNFDVDSNPRALYASLLREPLARLLSLFNHFAFPDNAVEDYARQARRESHEELVADGLDPSSLRRSIERSDKFRRHCSNQQCYYLSGGEATFEAVRERLHGLNHLLGTLESVDRFNVALGEIVGSASPGGHHNRSREALDPQLLREPGLMPLLESLVGEDRELYDHVQRDHGGLWQSLPRERQLRYYLQRPPRPRAQEFDDWRAVSVQAPPALSVQAGEVARLPLRLANGSDRSLAVDREGGLFASYRVLGDGDEVLLSDGRRSLVPDDLAAGAELAMEAAVEVPPALLPRARRLRVGLLYEGALWLEGPNPEHPALVDLEVTLD